MRIDSYSEGVRLLLGIALPPGDARFINFAENLLERLDQTGALEELARRWFGEKGLRRERSPDARTGNDPGSRRMAEPGLQCGTPLTCPGHR